MGWPYSDSETNLVDVESQSLYSVGSFGGVSVVESPSEIILTDCERKYLLYVQRGDVASTRRHLEEYSKKTEEFDKNCLDPLGRSAVTIAIENENLEMLEVLLRMHVKPKDALLYAISEEYVEGVELLLRFEEERHKPGHPYSWEMMSRETAKFTKDITPLVLAAHHNNYEILKMLLDRGATLPVPHDIKCGCDACLISTEEDSLRHSLSRINAYKALSSTSLISLSSKDPILTSFELSAELTRLMGLEHEFKEDYKKLDEDVRKFCTDLLDQVRSRSELSTMLNYDPNGSPWAEGEHHSLERLKLAIKHGQKGFVAHSNVQQLLGAIWYDGLPGFRRKSDLKKTVEILKLALMFPLFSLTYIINPESSRGKFMKKPFVKFICQCSSYMSFLMLLALASQRIEYALLEWFGSDWLQDLMEEWKMKERGTSPGIVECFIIIYVFGLIWAEIKTLWTEGLLEYIGDLWNIVDYITNTFFMTWIFLRMTSWILVHRDLWYYDKWPWYPREDWDDFDPMLISEGCFGAAMIFSYLKMINIFSVNPHLGPLQISLGRMIFDILKFFFLYTLVLFAFGCGLNQLMWYYAELEMQNCYHLPGGLPDYYDQKQSCLTWRRFANLFETSQSLFWASFGLVELEKFDLEGLGSFTRFWALLMFGSYSVINVIVLLNLLIAMMSSSYQAISEKADTEWKFARTRLWLSYFEDGSTVPPPFNLIPTIKGFKKLFNIGGRVSTGSFARRSRRNADFNHKNVMRLLVRRYITEEQRKADEKGITEDDINEVKQDISTFRYELVDILKNNGWNTLMHSIEDPIVIGKKGRALERKLLKGFNIGFVEGIVNDVVFETKKPGNLFGNLAKAFGRRSKPDWNARMMRQSFKTRDQIGSYEQSMKRSEASLKKRIKLENENLLNSMNPENIVEYNPNLQEYTSATRIAYAKFKVNTLKKEKEKQRSIQHDEQMKEKTFKANLELEREMEEQKIEYRPPSCLSSSSEQLKKENLNESEKNKAREKIAEELLNSEMNFCDTLEISKTNEDNPVKPQDKEIKRTDNSSEISCKERFSEESVKYKPRVKASDVENKKFSEESVKYKPRVKALYDENKKFSEESVKYKPRVKALSVKNQNFSEVSVKYEPRVKALNDEFQNLSKSETNNVNEKISENTKNQNLMKSTSVNINENKSEDTKNQRIKPYDAKCIDTLNNNQNFNNVNKEILNNTKNQGIIVELKPYEDTLSNSQKNLSEYFHGKNYSKENENYFKNEKGPTRVSNIVKNFEFNNSEQDNNKELRSKENSSSFISGKGKKPPKLLIKTKDETKGISTLNLYSEKSSGTSIKKTSDSPKRSESEIKGLSYKSCSQEQFLPPVKAKEILKLPVHEINPVSTGSSLQVDKIEATSTGSLLSVDKTIAVSNGSSLPVTKTNSASTGLLLSVDAVSKESELLANKINAATNGSLPKQAVVRVRAKGKQRQAPIAPSIEAAKTLSTQIDPEEKTKESKSKESISPTSKFTISCESEAKPVVRIRKKPKPAGLPVTESQSEKHNYESKEAGSLSPSKSKNMQTTTSKEIAKTEKSVPAISPTKIPVITTTAPQESITTVSNITETTKPTSEDNISISTEGKLATNESITVLECSKPNELLTPSSNLLHPSTSGKELNNSTKRATLTPSYKPSNSLTFLPENSSKDNLKNSKEYQDSSHLSTQNKNSKSTENSTRKQGKSKVTGEVVTGWL